MLSWFLTFRQFASFDFRPLSVDSKFAETQDYHALTLQTTSNYRLTIGVDLNMFFSQTLFLVRLSTLVVGLEVFLKYRLDHSSVLLELSLVV